MAVFIRMFVRTMSTIKSAHLESSSRVLQVTWDGKEHNGRVAKYPVTWLRDSCLCSECYQPSCDSRLMDLRELDPLIQPKNVKVADPSHIEITWPNDHVSTFGAEWLMKRDFGRHGHQFIRPRDSPLPLETTLWRAEMKDNIKTFQYNEFAEDDAVLYDWIVAMEELGIARLTDAPLDTQVMSDIGARIAYLKPTNYGYTFRVESKDDPSNIAYTTDRLCLHTDLNFFEYTPGVQLLHCIRQPEEMTGGENEFVDGFRAAEDLRTDDPEAFRLLTEVLVDFHDKGTDAFKYRMHFRRPVILLDERGAVISVDFNNSTRDTISHIPLDQVQAFYIALKKLNALFYDPRNLIEIKLQPGEIICFHNHRVLHGRKSFEIKLGGHTRLLMGGYIDWDEMRSRRRVLMDEQSQ